jgi:hypothetical protein
MNALSIAFIGLQTVDTFLTMWAVNHGFTEANPLMAPIADSWVSPVVKIAPAILVAIGLAWLTKRWLRTRTVALVGQVAVVVFMVGILASNFMEMGK